MFMVEIVHGNCKVEYVTNVEKGECESGGDSRYAMVFNHYTDAARVAKLYRFTNGVTATGWNRCGVVQATQDAGSLRNGYVSLTNRR